ncbi:hypothetical protein D3C72_1091950 [compost metagenome]
MGIIVGAVLVGEYSRGLVRIVSTGIFLFSVYITPVRIIEVAAGQIHSFLRCRHSLATAGWRTKGSEVNRVGIIDLLAHGQVG